MGTKQLRLSDFDQIKSRIASFVGKPINIVFADQTTITGILDEVKGSSIVMKNMRLKKSIFPLEKISEIYLDTTI